ncbi:unnamed protein product [Ranitomeya imitator]|uniref:Uncharacterized protein n=1 Tax=Ranitomeya imitator TaxID=111125 RepID=A0ABN9KU92_9NEOB|nr:unnamed protein product [Ranitomeya imitator]
MILLPDTDSRYRKNIGTRYRNSDTANIGRYPILAVSECSTLNMILCPLISRFSIRYALLEARRLLVKKFVRRTLDPRFDGPFQVLLMTPTSVKLEGRPT